MNHQDDNDDTTEVAGSTAPDQDLLVWSSDDLDDEVTAVVDDLDDEVTAVAVVDEVDDLDDEVTAVMNRAGERGVAAATAPTTRLASKPRSTASPRSRAAASSPRTATSRSRTTASTGVSLRDRIPEQHGEAARDAWQPPSRPRSPEFQAAPTSRRRTAVPVIVAMVLATALIFAAVWWLLPADDEELPALGADARIEAPDAN